MTNRQLITQESKWFEKKASQYQEIYVPKEVALALKLKHDDKIAVRIQSTFPSQMFPARVRFRIKRDGNCFRFQVPSNIQKMLQGPIKVQIVKLDRPKKISLKENEIDIARFPANPENISQWIDAESLVIWDNIKFPIITPQKINALEVAKYLGLYYSDGGKTSHMTSIASTKRMGRIILDNYKKLIKNERCTIIVCYRKLDNEIPEDIKKRIVSYWSDLISIPASNVKIIGEKRVTYWSDEFGILRIDDSRMLTLQLHLWLTKEVLKEGEKNPEILEEFLKGGLLGDGYVSLRRKNAFQFIGIASNPKEYHVWEYVCKKLGIKHEIKKGRENQVYIRFRDYYKTVSLLKNGVFSEYEKRRKRLVEGLKNSIETYVLQALAKESYPIPIKGPFGRKTPSFFYVNKGGDLVKHNLISLKDRKVMITQEGKDFINDLIELKLVEA